MNMLSDITVDVRHAIRTLRKNPAFTFTVLATLTLAIGANIAIFTLANALILASLPVSHPDRLVRISTLNPKGHQGNLSIATFEIIQRQKDLFANSFAWLGGGMATVEMNGTPFAGAVDEVAGDYYSTLDIQPALGRFITPMDAGLEHFTPSRVAVISYSAWQEYYHGNPAVLGKTILINGQPYAIVGVHPSWFGGLIREISSTVTVPAKATASTAERFYDPKRNYYTVIGRLRDGVDAARARAELEAIWPTIRRTTAPANGPERDAFLASRVQVEPAARGLSYLRERFTRPLYILLTIAALLLLLACLNLATIGLARAHHRAAELSLRAALGAGRWRLVRASLIESLLLAIAGALPGLALAYWLSVKLAEFMWQGYVPLALSLTPDGHVLAFTVSVAVGAGVVFGIIPAWRAGGRDPRLAVQNASARVTGGLGFAGRALVVLQLALSFAIVAAAMLFGRGIERILDRDPGFSANRLLVAQLMPRKTDSGFDEAAYLRQLLQSLRSIPGVAAASLAHDRPVGSVWKKEVLPSGIGVDYRLVAPGFFDTLQIPMLRGRDFDLRDDEQRPLVAIVSARLARSLSPSGDVIGQHLRIGDVPGEFRVVGVAADATLDDPRAPNAAALYVPIFQHPDFLGGANAIIRTPTDPTDLTHALTKSIDSLGHDYPLTIETVDKESGRILLPERILSLLTGFFGALALLLAGVGLYGLLSYTVSRRIGEIGVRVALGATSRAIATLVLREIAILMAIGLGAGVAIAAAGIRVIQSFLTDVAGRDVSTLLTAAGVLIVCVTLAALMPTLRAARIDPAVALRHE
ncbi:MAG TPA: ADOP family duplicated permease [Bryobacteraceae bacterium]|jgi:predicted permease|nr:ADOP family duplicated permease [Bryobacteraceae bacterium]